MAWPPHCSLRYVTCNFVPVNDGLNLQVSTLQSLPVLNQSSDQIFSLRFSLLCGSRCDLNVTIHSQFETDESSFQSLYHRRDLRCKMAPICVNLNIALPCVQLRTPAKLCCTTQVKCTGQQCYLSVRVTRVLHELLILLSISPT